MIPQKCELIEFDEWVPVFSAMSLNDNVYVQRVDYQPLDLIAHQFDELEDNCKVDAESCEFFSLTHSFYDLSLLDDVTKLVDAKPAEHKKTNTNTNKNKNKIKIKSKKRNKNKNKKKNQQKTKNTNKNKYTSFPQQVRAVSRVLSSMHSLEEPNYTTEEVARYGYSDSYGGIGGHMTPASICLIKNVVMSHWVAKHYRYKHGDATFDCGSGPGHVAISYGMLKMGPCFGIEISSGLAQRSIDGRALVEMKTGQDLSNVLLCPGNVHALASTEPAKLITCFCSDEAVLVSLSLAACKSRTTTTLALTPVHGKYLLTTGLVETLKVAANQTPHARSDGSQFKNKNIKYIDRRTIVIRGTRMARGGYSTYIIHLDMETRVRVFTKRLEFLDLLENAGNISLEAMRDVRAEQDELHYYIQLVKREDWNKHDLSTLYQQNDEPVCALTRLTKKRNREHVVRHNLVSMFDEFLSTPPPLPKRRKAFTTACNGGWE
jgi:hypothetical protein